MAVTDPSAVLKLQQLYIKFVYRIDTVENRVDTFIAKAIDVSCVVSCNGLDEFYCVSTCDSAVQTCTLEEAAICARVVNTVAASRHIYQQDPMPASGCESLFDRGQLSAASTPGGCSDEPASF